MPIDPQARLDALMAAEVAGEPLRLVHFWGDRPRRDGRLGHTCFSQWWRCDVEIDGYVYPSAEHWMMAEKARLFGDEKTLALILESASPGAAKALGRQVTGYDEDLWERRRYAIVVDGNLAKFGQNRDLGEVLRVTGSQVLVEASPHDVVWGIGVAADHPDAGSPTAWRGSNLLGFALMETRDRLWP